MVVMEDPISQEKRFLEMIKNAKEEYELSPEPDSLKIVTTTSPPAPLPTDIPFNLASNSFPHTLPELEFLLPFRRYDHRNLSDTDLTASPCLVPKNSVMGNGVGKLTVCFTGADVVIPESFLKKAAEIGGGVFGTVYISSLGEDDGDNLAIKNLVVSNMIDREVRVLGKVRHPNLVSLIIV
ncbi:hypothetical protein L2E82_27506 [Cichorium intybus]|uniref:Uncharacterized protein n=1 Tax=Cichorium intybus TaxID=13427 RepID=A0ACB9CTT7_CICIN|nr:hypothetical protein L2E82_27506 [Cichorium intybus]